MTALAGCENFYVIVGLSAGALIGLQFVLITLIADMPIAGGQVQAGQAFAHAHEAMLGIAAAALLLFFIGIHNAWGAVTYRLFVNRTRTG